MAERLYEDLFKALERDGNIYVNWTTEEIFVKLSNMVFNCFPYGAKMEFGKVRKIIYDVIVEYTLAFAM